jgi:hypothetical protein
MKDANIPRSEEGECEPLPGGNQPSISGDVMDYYEVIVQHQIAVGQQPVKLGTAGRCRYCGVVDGLKFQQIAHAFPEALGNDWLISLDECDDCNAKFSVCDAALTEAVGSVLTFGGVRRKHGSIRKFGRSNGAVSVMHDRRDGRRHQSVKLKGLAEALGFEIGCGEEFWRIRIPMPDVAFIPARAYKALAKMGFALIPEQELKHFQSERTWLLGLSGDEPVRDHHVVASFGSIGNAPPLVTGCLLRRRDPTLPLPYMLFVGCIGSICMQLAIKADVLDAHVPPDAVCRVNLRWVNVIGGPAPPVVRISYDHRVVWEWSASASTLQPVEAMLLTFNQRTLEGVLEPVFR